MSAEASAKPINGLEISAPEWFQRDDFCKWIKSKSTASWYNGHCIGECCDVFTIFDHGSGPDDEEIPASIWQEICDMAKEQGLVYCLIWIKPV